MPGLDRLAIAMLVGTVPSIRGITKDRYRDYLRTGCPGQQRKWGVSRLVSGQGWVQSVETDAQMFVSAPTGHSWSNASSYWLASVTGHSTDAFLTSCRERLLTPRLYWWSRPTSAIYRARLGAQKLSRNRVNSRTA